MAGAWQSSVYAWNGGSYQIWELGAETATRRYLYATTTYT